MKVPAASQEEKEDRVFILSKKSEYFYDGQAPHLEDWNQFAEETGMRMMCAAETPRDGKYPLPEGVDTIGHLNPDQFAQELGKSKAMVGIGHPRISPSPYISL